MNTISIEKTTPADIPKIQQVAEIAFKERFEPILGKAQVDYMIPMMYGTKVLTKEMTSGQNTYFLLYENDLPIGYLGLKKEKGHLCLLDKIYLLTDHQGKGFGRKLFEKAKAEVKRMTASPCRMQLHVNRHNFRAYGFYEKMGMHKVLAKKTDIGNGFFMDDYIMEIILT